MTTERIGQQKTTQLLAVHLPLLIEVFFNKIPQLKWVGGWFKKRHFHDFYKRNFSLNCRINGNKVCGHKGGPTFSFFFLSSFLSKLQLNLDNYQTPLQGGVGTQVKSRKKVMYGIWGRWGPLFIFYFYFVKESFCFVQNFSVRKISTKQFGQLLFVTFLTLVKNKRELFIDGAVITRML